MKLPLFEYIDQAIAMKHELRFEIDQAQRAIDSFFLSQYESKDNFVNYTSRVKADESLKEKIIRRNYTNAVSAERLFSHISDLIGCRIECRFIHDEEDLYRSLFDHFQSRRSDGFYRCNLDPRIELRLDDPQPKSQKNGTRSYRIDGHFLGPHVLNFELQIKSMVNVFWNEIDHRILYKNYNYVLTEKFVHDIMSSIHGDLTVIDRQMEMMYDHLRTLDRPKEFKPQEQIKTMIGRLIQDVYLIPLRDEAGITFDFRSSIDLITDFLFARVEYETREQYATEFLRIMDDAFSGQRVLALFGETIEFTPSIHYHSEITTDLGTRLECVVNEDILWNLLVHILFDLNSHMDPSHLFRTFVDYLHFRVIHTIRRGFTQEGKFVRDYEHLIDRMTRQALDTYLNHPLPEHFTALGRNSLLRNVVVTLANERPDDPACFDRFCQFYPGRTLEPTKHPLMEAPHDHALS